MSDGKATDSVPAPVFVLGGIATTQFGASLAQQIFDDAGPSGTVFLRVLFAAIVLAAIWTPRVRGHTRRDLGLALAFGVSLAFMNLSFYESLDRIPQGIAVTIEFAGPLTVAVMGSRRAMDLVWVTLAAAGIVLLANAGGAGIDTTGAALALLAGVFWGSYILLSARVGQTFPRMEGLSIAMIFGAVLLVPFGVAGGGTALLEPHVLAIGAGVAVLSSAIPYALELEALRRLPTGVFGVLMSMEPAVAALSGLVVLGQVLHVREWAGIALVVAASAGAARFATRETWRGTSRFFSVSHPDSFGAKSTLEVGGTEHEIFRLDALQSEFDVARLPYSLKVLLENLLRNEDGESVTKETIESVAKWVATDEPSIEIAYSPSRVLMQDFTGVPAIVDLAAMRDAMEELGGDPTKINPLVPVELVIDHSIQVDSFAEKMAFKKNAELEFERNQERYAFLRWGQTAFDNFSVVPPNTGICHQVNLEYLSQVVAARDGQAFPDTLVGTDSHTTMVNGLGVLGWGVGGIEAEAAMLGQPVSMLLPQVVGFRMDGELPEGATATDLVLTVTEMLRERGVVGKFVEFFGPGLANMPLADRATIGNMSPEFGSTCAIFPVDAETLRYMEFTGRPTETLELAEAYTREQGMFHDADADDATYSDTLELDMSTVEPSLAGPKRPQDRISLSDAASAFLSGLNENQDVGEQTESDMTEEAGLTAQATKKGSKCTYDGEEFDLEDGAVVIAAITSCTNTSNPAVMLGAGLLARNAVEKGLTRKPWVKTSLAPGSKVVMDYYERAGLVEPLSALGFDLVGYGCTTCIGNSGPLPDEISEAVTDADLTVCSVLSGNRNFEGRIHAEVRNNYLASPPLVVAYALAGRMDLDLYEDPLGQDQDGNDVYLKDIWPSQAEIHAEIESAVESDMFRKSYGEVFEGDENWENLDIPEGDRYAWDEDSTYVKRPPYFEGMEAEAPEGFADIKGARILAKLGDSVTTDHISPAGAIKKDTPGGKYLLDNGVEQKDFNSYGSRRGNHEVMMRGTFANVRLRNQLAPGTEGGYTRRSEDGEDEFIFDAAMEMQEEGTPLGVLAGKEYGSGSSRDWAAKGPRLQGIKFAIAESFERIHRSNLVGMGILPLQFPDGESVESLGLTGFETFDLEDLEDGARELKVTATPDNGEPIEFTARVRIDTPNEWLYYRNGGILHFVLRGRA